MQRIHAETRRLPAQADVGWPDQHIIERSGCGRWVAFEVERNASIDPHTPA